MWIGLGGDWGLRNRTLERLLPPCSPRLMGRRRLPTIGDDAVQGLGFTAHCGGCRRTRYWSAREAIRAFGASTPVMAVQVRLRCEACGATGRSRPGVQFSFSITDFYRRLPNVGRIAPPSADPTEEVEF